MGKQLPVTRVLGLLPVAMTLTLAACGGGGGGGGGTSVEQGSPRTVSGQQQSASGNRPPSISGLPPGKATPGKAYNFLPKASDPDGDALRFSITNRPAWAFFDGTNGRLRGTPAPSDAGTYKNIVISVSDGEISRQLKAFTIRVAQSASGGGSAASPPARPPADKNRPPSIGGLPARKIEVGKRYKFRPTAVDPDGDPLSFGIQNRPKWARFNSKNGVLAGRPRSDDVGVYDKIRILVTDGDEADELTTFRIEVTGPRKDRFRVLWRPPTTNVDGSRPVNLAGYRIYLGTRPGVYNSKIKVNNRAKTSYEFRKLAPGTYFVVLTAVNRAGEESAPTSELSVTL